MKRANGKPIVARRNPFVVAACMRKAGSHRKSNKALRRQENQRHWGHNSMVE